MGVKRRFGYFQFYSTRICQAVLTSSKSEKNKCHKHNKLNFLPAVYLHRFFFQHGLDTDIYYLYLQEHTFALHCKQPFLVVMAIYNFLGIQSKKISNDQELIRSDPISCPPNQKGNIKIHKLTAVYKRHAR